MLSKSRNLLVFEGERTERKLFASLEKNILRGEPAVACAFGADIYQLYETLRADEDLDLIALLKERPHYSGELDGYPRRTFEGIYLFFDFDGHATAASPEKIDRLLRYFDNETERGKLFISYPMVEALRHFRSAEHLRDLTVSAKDLSRYKELAARDCRPQLNNLNKYTPAVWQELIHAHLRKLNYIARGQFALPAEAVAQTDIFTKQRAQWQSEERIAVLSAIPPFILDYFGCEQTRRLLGL